MTHENCNVGLYNMTEHFHVACIPWSLSDFEVSNAIPCVSCSDSKDLTQMVEDICYYQNVWNTCKHSFTQEDLYVVNKTLLTTFIHHTNIGEGIGSQDETETKTLVQAVVDNDWSITSNLTGELHKATKETIKLIKAYSHIHNLECVNTHKEPSILGLLEREYFLQETHVILMRDVTSIQTFTAPGEFSLNERRTYYKGRIHVYPKKNSREEWETTIDALIDRYNILVHVIKRIADLKTRTLHMFKCAAWFIFSLVSAHPFADGNGRLCRLIVSYILNTFSPFPTPIYHDCDETKNRVYIETIIKAREVGNGPSDLTTLLVECNWNSWRLFFSLMGLSDNINKSGLNVIAEEK